MPYPWSAGNVLTATDLNSALAAKTDTAMVQNAQTGTTYSFALADASKLLTTSNASPVSVTVTKQATVTWVTGTQLRIMNLGAGLTTLVADTGVTINGNVALKQYQGGKLIRTASDVWLFVPTASVAGMDLITPTSVAGSGVTVSGGQVSFSAATAVSVNGCFTSAYDHYLAVGKWTASAGATVAARLRLAGSDASGANYSQQGLNASITTVTATQTTGATSVRVSSASNAYDSAATITLYGPGLAVATILNSIGLRTFNTIERDDWAGVHSLATAYDGITLIPSAGNLTGTLRIYGLRNS